MSADPVVLTAALTGPVATKRDHPGLPTSPEEIATAAATARAAGAAVVHVHLRDENGRPSADLDIARRTVALIQERCDALVQLSTGVGLDVAFEEREQIVEARPAMATLNVCSMTFGAGEFRNPPAAVRRLAGRMRELDIKPELEIYDSGHLEVALRLRDEGLLVDPLQFSIVMGVAGGMAADPAELLRLLARLPEDSIWQAIAIGRSNLSMTAIALALGGNARTGLEDTLHIARGELAQSNAQLVERLAAVARSLGRPLADPGDARSAFRLS